METEQTQPDPTGAGPSVEVLGGATLRRVEWLTLALGSAATIWAAWHWGWRGALGLAIGVILSWVNFRWLKGGVQDFSRAALTQVGAEQVHVSKSGLLKFFGRFALLLGVVYVILTRTSLPAISVLAGLFASASGVVAGLLFEVVSTRIRSSAKS